MEFGLREYLLILGSVLIVGLLADGIRRTIKHRRQGLKLDLMASPPESPVANDVSAPRPVKRTTAAELEPQLDRDPLFDSSDTSQLNLWASEIKPETMKAAAPEDWFGDVPSETQTEPLSPLEEHPSESLFGTPELETHNDELDAVSTPSSGQRQEPTWGGLDVSFDDDGLSPARPAGGASASEVTAPAMVDMSKLDPQLRVDPLEETSPEIESNPSASNDTQEVHEQDMAILADGPHRNPIDPVAASGGLKSTMGRLFGLAKARVAAAKDPENLESSSAAMGESVEGADPAFDDGLVTPARPVSPAPEPNLDDLVLVELKPARSDRFVAVNLHTACLRAGLRKTEQGMYQRIPLDQSAAPLFTLVNSLEPGTFESDAKSVDSPGFFIFSELSKQTDPVFAVNELISGARGIAREIGGDVFDEAGVAISKEWIDLARARAGQQQLMRP